MGRLENARPSCAARLPLRPNAGFSVSFRAIRRHSARFRIVLYLGILADYRRPFWHAIHYALRRGKIEAVFGISFVAYHLIEFTREALRGEQNASFYSQARMERSQRRFLWRQEEETLFT